MARYWKGSSKSLGSSKNLSTYLFIYLSIIVRPVVKKKTARVVAARQNNVLLLWRAI